MIPRTEIIDNKIVNSVEQLASFLKPGDVFRKLKGRTQYRFNALEMAEECVLCENLDNHAMERIYFNAPVFKLVFI